MPTPAPVVGVLDDEPEMRKALRRLLTCRGFRVEEFECGEDLLAALDSQPLNFLLLDLHMPGISGFDVLEAFRSRSIHVSVIVVTAHDEPGTEERVRLLGASAYLKKPVDRDALLSALTAASPPDQSANLSHQIGQAGHENEHPPIKGSPPWPG